MALCASSQRMFRRFSQSSIASSLHAFRAALPGMPSMRPGSKPGCEADAKAGSQAQGQTSTGQVRFPAWHKKVGHRHKAGLPGLQALLLVSKST